MSSTNSQPQPIQRLGTTPKVSEINATKRISSQELLGATGQVDIAHDGEVYRLRRTRLGKLILTK
jgi:hemin uptake protein HemP